VRDLGAARIRSMQTTARLRGKVDELKELLHRSIKQPSHNRSGVLGLLQDIGQRLGISVGPGYMMTVQGEHRVGIGVFRAF